MKARRLVPALLVALAAAAPAGAQAGWYSEAMNGNACVPYPGGATSPAYAWQHWLWFRGYVHCPLTMNENWRAQDLAYVLFQGAPGTGGTMTARLCVHAGDTTVTCGATRTIAWSGGMVGINWVALPATMPSYTSGAFLQIQEHSGNLAILTQITPVWYR